MNKNEIGILVVDDELIVRESLTKWFREDGFRVESAENAAIALKKLQAGRWNLMLVDIKMPGMDGIELLQRVRETNKSVIVIIITAFATVDTAVKALKEGAFDYITKPIDPDYLDHLVEKALNQQQLTQENQKLRDTVSELATGGEIIGDSPEMKKVLELIAHSRADRYHRDDPRRKRDGEGTGRARHPLREPPQVLSDRDRQLRGDDRDSSRKRIVRPRARGLHRRPVPPEGKSGTGGRRHALPG